MEVITGYLVQILSMPYIKLIISAIWMTISFLIGDVNIWLIACWVLYLTDMFFGLTINAYHWTFDWHRLRKWIFKFILYSVAIIVWHMIDLIVVHRAVEFGGQNIIILYLGVTEALSVLRHLAKLWLNIPLKLIKRLEGMRDEMNTPWSQAVTVSPLIQNETSTSPSPTQSQNFQTETL